MADQQQALVGGFSKRHVSGMMKHLRSEEQQVKAQEVAAAYKKMFAEKDWKAVLARMQNVVDEDHLRLSGEQRAAPFLAAGQTLITTPPKRIKSTSSIISTGGSRTPSTPRKRCDVTSCDPGTPLSPSTPGNAFAAGGFWEQLTPKTPVPQTTLPAMPASPYSPIVPRDHEARTAYKQVKDEVDAMARTICADRWSAYSSITDSNDIPKCLVRSKDVLRAAEMTLEYRQVDLKTAIEPQLPELLEHLANQESEILRAHAVKDIFELLDLDMWLQIDEETLVFTTLLDAQRDLIRMHRDRRRSNFIKVTDSAIQQAWATRILEDAEHMDEADGDNSSTHSDDKDYGYNNFLRSIKGATSSTSDLASMSDCQSSTNLASLRSSSSLQLSRETTLESQQSSNSPVKSPNGPPSLRNSASPQKSHGALVQASTSPERPSHASMLRSRENSLSQSPSVGKLTYARQLHSQKSTRSQNPSPEKAQNLAFQSPQATLYNSPSTKERTLPSRIITYKREVEPTPLSPEERAFRRMGASHTDLNIWAEDIKKMEERRDANLAAQHVTSRSAVHESVVSREQENPEDGPRQVALERINNASTPTRQDIPLRRSNAARLPRRMPQKQQPFTNDLAFRQASRTAQFPQHIPWLSPSSPPPASPTSPPPLPPLPPSTKYAISSQASLHDSVRRKQHVRSKSTISHEKMEEEEWNAELKRMEDREMVRQEQEEAWRGGRRQL